MNKKMDTSFFKSNVSVGNVDLRNFEPVVQNNQQQFPGGPRNRHNYVDYDRPAQIITIKDLPGTTVIQKDNDNNEFYAPFQLNNISEYEAKVRLVNNEIDNYFTAANMNAAGSVTYPGISTPNNHCTHGVIYKDKKVGQQKRKETMDDMIKPEDYVFIAKVNNKGKTGFIGVDGEFVENWGAPVDASKVNYYDTLEECVSDALLHNYKNSEYDGPFPAYGAYGATPAGSANGEPFIAIPRKEVK